MKFIEISDITSSGTSFFREPESFEVFKSAACPVFAATVSPTVIGHACAGLNSGKIRAELSVRKKTQHAGEAPGISAEEAGCGNQIFDRANNYPFYLLDSIDIPVVLLGPDLAIRHFTPSAEKALNLSPDKIGRSLAEIELPLRLPNLEQLLLNVIKTGYARELEVQDTQGRWYQLVLRPYRPGKSKTEGAVMNLIDIHDRKLSEKTALRLAALVRDSGEAVIIRDLRDRIIAWNSGAQKMYGYTEAETLGISLSRLIPESESIRTQGLVRLSMQGKKPAPIETRRRAKDGRILDVLLTVTVLHDEKGTPVELAATERDITEQKHADRELRRLHASVIAAQETERKRMARDLHDGVGQILSGVKFRLEALSGKIVSKGGAAAQILEIGGLMGRAIAEIRLVSKNLMPSELEDLGLAPALRTLCRDFKENGGVPVTLRTGPLPATVTPELALALFRITQEALNNIRKHSGATMVTVDLSRIRSEVVLSVSDNGIGLAVGGGRPRAGRGIGLGSMRERAESNGGRIEFDSKTGVGTTLRVHAPFLRPGETDI